MKAFNYRLFYLFLFLIIGISCTTLKRSRTNIKLSIPWEEFSERSEYTIDSISPQSFQGKWYSFYHINGDVKGVTMETKYPEPLVAEIKESGIKLEGDSVFRDFSLIKNTLLKQNRNKKDTGFINLATKDSLILTWRYITYHPLDKKKKEEYIYLRYFYKRSPRP
jgi:hypothetical protein